MKINKTTTIILIIITLVLTSINTIAVDQTEYVPTYTTNFTNAASRGALITPTYNLTLYNLTKYSSDAATRCRLFTYPGLSSLVNSTFTGNDCLINYNITYGQVYCIDTDKSGASYLGFYNQTAAPTYFPRNFTHLNIINGTNTGCTALNPQQMWTLTYINTINYTASTLSNGTNFSITAVNSWNGSSILSFNASINGTIYNTTTGQINTTIPSNSTTLWNITLISSGFDNRTYTNYNVSTNLIGNLTFTDITPPTINCNINGLTNISGYTMNLNITVTEDYLTNTTITFEKLPTVTNNTHRTNYEYSNTTFNITNQTEIGNYQINITAIDFNGNSENYTCNYTIIGVNSTYRVYVYDYTNTTLISTISIYDTNTSETQTGNPFNKDLTNYLSKIIPWNYVRMEIEDTSYYHIDQNSSFNITRFESIFRTTMTPNKLVISFINSSGGSTTTTGFINDEYPSTRGFINSSIIIIQQNLSEGLVQVIFNTFENWTQYYEYKNDYKTYINETLAIIPLTNLWSGYFQVLDVSGSPLEEVTIRMQYAIGTNNSVLYGQLLGQRLTAPDGYTFFIADKSSQSYLTIYKNGYTPQTYIINFGDESFTRSSPKTFYLRTDNTIVKENAWAYIPYEYTNTTPIPITITSIDYDRIEIQTPFRNASGFGLKDVTNKDILGRTRFTLTAGQDYNTTPEDIILYIYLDDELWTNYTIKYNPKTEKTNIFTVEETESSLKTKIGAVIEFLALLFMIIIMNLIYKDSRAGMHTFMTGTIVLAIINPTYYIWAGFIGGGFYIFKLVRYVIEE